MEKQLAHVSFDQSVFFPGLRPASRSSGFLPSLWCRVFTNLKGLKKPVLARPFLFRAVLRLSARLKVCQSALDVLLQYVNFLPSALLRLFSTAVLAASSLVLSILFPAAFWTWFPLFILSVFSVSLQNVQLRPHR